MWNIQNTDLGLNVRKNLSPGEELIPISSTATGRSINTESTFWELQGIRTYFATAQTLYLSSTSVLDTTQPILVEGLDGDYNAITGIATLGGQNQIEIKDFTGGALTFLRVGNAPINVIGANNLNGDVYIASSGALTGGVPDTFSTIQGFIKQDHNIGRASFFTVPAGKTAYLTHSSFSTRKNDEVIIEFIARTENGIILKPQTINLYQNFTPTPLGYITFVEKTDFEIRLLPQNNNSAVSWVGEFKVIDNTLIK